MGLLRGVTAEDVWSALDTAKTAEEKKKMLTLNKHGIWDLKSNKEETKGKTTLMYLIENGCLDKKTIAKVVPAKAWMAKDKTGETSFGYLYKRWVQNDGKSNIDIKNSDIDVPPEKHASLVWYGINYQKSKSHKINDAGITDLLLVTPPKVLETGKDIHKDRFWGAFFKNDGAIDSLFQAIISVSSFRRPIIASKHREDFAIWRKSLQIARMKDGKRWVEAHKILADATIMMFLMENISYSKEQVGDISTDSKELRAKEWCNEISEVLLDLYSSGGRIDSALKRKDAICIEHKKEVDKLEKSDIFLLLNRRSRVERFNEDVINETQRMDVLLGAWLSYQEKFRLSTVIENQSNVDNRKHQQVL